MRYAIFTSYYLDANNDEDAIRMAKYHASRQDQDNDDQCSVDTILKAQFGQLKREEIYPLKTIK